MNARRRFVLLAAGGVLTGATGLGMSQERKARVGWLFGGSPTASPHLAEAFKRAMQQLGHFEGENVEYLIVAAEGFPERLEPLAHELVAKKVDVILAGPPAVARAARRATRTIPIVMSHVPDPVGIGLVASLARPGGNVTGVSSQTEVLMQKAIEFLREIIPGIERIGVLINEANPSAVAFWSHAQSAGEKLRIKLERAVANRPLEIEPAVASLVRARVKAVAVPTDPMFLQERRALNELLRERKLPGAFLNRDHALDGGLVSYAPSILENYRLAAIYVDKILRGAKPAELPVQQSDRYELVVNLRTARELGLTIPASVLIRADRVIE
jgi:putative ABC transport system substrate-binding protein